MMVWKIIFLFQGCILRFHVNLPGCSPAKNWIHINPSWCVPFLTWWVHPDSHSLEIPIPSQKDTNHTVDQNLRWFKVGWWFFQSLRSGNFRHEFRSNWNELFWFDHWELHPRKLTCPPKRDYFNRKYIFQPLVVRGHVSFSGSIEHLLKNDSTYCSLHLLLRGTENGLEGASTKKIRRKDVSTSEMAGTNFGSSRWM